jgi:ribosomal protein L11 methyltransferase
MKFWPLLHVIPSPDTSHEAWDAFCALVFEEGAAGCEEKGGGDVPEEAILSFLEGESAAAADYPFLETAAELAVRILGDGTRTEARVGPAIDWAANWRQYFHARPVTDTLWVGPPEERASPLVPPGALFLVIEPGSAFGTGTHETTQGCLELLEGVARSGGAMEAVLDMGTGSGILAIAAAKLGARLVVGVERDDVAESNFRENARLNGCEGALRYVAGDGVGAGLAALHAAGAGPPDLVLCNMLSNEFDALLAPLRALERPLILSGFLREEERPVGERLAQTGWSVRKRLAVGDWLACLVVPC